jgi:hypothetical protein
MTQERHKKRQRIRVGQELFVGWAQISAVMGVGRETARKTWAKRRWPIWFEGAKPVTSRSALVDYARQRVKEARKRHGWG